MTETEDAFGLNMVIPFTIGWSEKMKRSNQKYFVVKMCILAISLCVLSGCIKEDRAEIVTEEGDVIEETLNSEEMSDNGPETEDVQSEEEAVSVNTAEDLLEAIAPGATIKIAPGYYNLSEYTEEIWNKEGEAWNQTHPYVQLRECFDGGIEVVVRNADDIFIIGDLDNTAATELVVETRYGAVFNFENCNNVSLSGLTMGHTQAGACDESVITFSNCTDIHMSAMDLYGCGMYGFAAKDGSGNIYVQSCTIRECEAGPFYITEPVGTYEFRNCWLKESFGGGYYEPSEGAELSFVECNFGQNETNYWYFNEDAVFTDCYWEEITEYPDVEPGEEDVFDYDRLILVDSNEVEVADTYYAYMVVDQQSGETMYYPGITLHLSEDGTGYYETEEEYFEFIWYCETDGTLTLEYEVYRYADLYVDHQDGFDMFWIMVQMDEDVIWFY